MSRTRLAMANERLGRARGIAWTRCTAGTSTCVNMEPEMLRFIDEHFGALSLKTVSSTVHFARYSLMTNFHGHNQSRLARELQQPLEISDIQRARQRQRTFACFDRRSHGADSGRCRPSLSSRSSIRAPVTRMRWSEQPDMPRLQRSNSSWMPLSRRIRTRPNREKVAYPPWIGPIITEERPDTRGTRGPSGIIALAPGG